MGTAEWQCPGGTRGTCRIMAMRAAVAPDPATGRLDTVVDGQQVRQSSTDSNLLYHRLLTLW